ncbi:hypothetical protein NP233_g6984 [Leucocoprinus birnbaumii]|uniref:Calcineurin-like phosphoesterase domain-containing protein n=1 Tax=Leucocoprinus birnbaumii TaxID=56174 RepID=A0AAD5VQ23_9AGAR|nr:hypothetical protein NP233_g6984 [Leucocoprinus birnbaumii]
MRSSSRSGALLRSLLSSPVVTTNVLRLLWVSGEVKHVLLLSDTHVTIPSLSNSVPTLPRPQQFLVDRFLRKSWYVTSRLDPDVIFFMGDVLSQGKLVEDEAQFTKLVQKLEQTFPFGDSTEVYYLPGNNDVGMGVISASARGIRAYFQNHFGPLNRIVSINNFTFFALDAPGLVDEDYQRNAKGVAFDRWEPISKGVVEAVRNVAAENHHPLVLLSHIPLYRPDGASCGPLRESGTINRGAGNGYQNTLRKQTTAFLMEALEPFAVFSGDNRDYCEYFHKGSSFNAEESIPEITVKSFSPAPHIRRPGFELLSLVDPTGLDSTQRREALLHRPCLLPDRKIIISGYMGWIIMTLLILLALNVRRIRQFRLSKQISPSMTPSPNQSHQGSPLLQEINGHLSPVWSPHTPFLPPTPRSSRDQIPATFRTPMAPATPTLRASSGPMTPQTLHDSPMLSAQLMPPMYDEEDVMFPDQYAIHREGRHAKDEEWTPIAREDFLDSDLSPSDNEESRAYSPPSQFISAPGSAFTHHRKPSAWRVIWSQTFTVGGRRRKIILLRLPRFSAWWRSFLDLIEIIKDADRRTLLRRRRGIIASTLIESISVLWPACVTWLVINCWMF